MRRVLAVLSGVLLALAAQLAAAPAPVTAENRPLPTFIRFVTGNLDEFWGSMLPEYGYRYASPRVVLFDRTTPSVCGPLTAGVTGNGPLYCRPERSIDLNAQWLGQLWHADVDFAVAIIVAHEWGHHLQDLVGIRSSPRPVRPGEAYSIQIELQADCLAGVWARATAHQGLLEPGDLEEAIATAIEFGDPDGTPQVHPQAHGAGPQRAAWFLRGYWTGHTAACQTF
jgi:predicted metalloprotease